MFDVLARRSDATLETLHIQTIEALPHAAFSAIQRMTYLRVVELPTHHDYTFWFSLALLPNLRIIKCQVVLDPLILPSSLDDIPSINKPFPSLTTLTIRGGLVECTWLLSFYKLQTVSSLSMSLQEPMDISLTISETRLDFFRTNATSLSNIFTVITQQLSENLKSLDLQFRRGLLCGDDESKFLDPPTITHQIIENLTSSFPNITRFTLDHGWKFNFDDADASLHLLGRSWPQLTRLHLSPSGVLAQWINSKPTLASLEFFMQHCHQLEDLAVYCNFSTPSFKANFNYESQPSPYSVESRLFRLDVGGSPNVDPRGVASTLWYLFPILEELE
ncbi:hypothetical protein C8Q75DRAFT_42936 [Abortiporus biennis]|nr:hypothetical protein C8Q75DRAFT_42936 [Abortiporus biennis]